MYILHLCAWVCFFFFLLGSWRTRYTLLIGRRHKQQHLYMQRVHCLWTSFSSMVVKHLERGAGLHHPWLTWSAVNRHGGELGSVTSFASRCDKGIDCITVCMGSSIASQVVPEDALLMGARTQRWMGNGVLQILTDLLWETLEFQRRLHISFYASLPYKHGLNESSWVNKLIFHLF